MRESNRTAVWSNAFYSLTQALSFFVIALMCVPTSICTSMAVH